MAELAPHLLKYDYIEPTLMGEMSLYSTQATDMNLSPLNDSIDVAFCH